MMRKSKLFNWSKQNKIWEILENRSQKITVDEAKKILEANPSKRYIIGDELLIVTNEENENQFSTLFDTEDLNQSCSSFIRFYHLYFLEVGSQKETNFKKGILKVNLAGKIYLYDEQYNPIDSEANFFGYAALDDNLEISSNQKLCRLM